MDKAVVLALPLVPKPIVGFFSKRYIAGSTRDDAFRVVHELGREGAMATLDILGEFISSLDQADANTRAYVDLVQQVAAQRLAEANVSVKLTALGLLLDRARCLSNMRALVRAAAETNGFVRIDMEDAQCTDATLAIYRTLRAEFPGRVGVVLQARLRRTMDDIDAVTDEPANFRLCKGIYLEPRAIAGRRAAVVAQREQRGDPRRETGVNEHAQLHPRDADAAVTAGEFVPADGIDASPRRET